MEIFSTIDFKYGKTRFQQLAKQYTRYSGKKLEFELRVTNYKQQTRIQLTPYDN